MDETLRAVRRRRRRRERRLLRRLWNLAPLLVLALAWLLSAGVVRLMEAPAPKHASRSQAQRPAPQLPKPPTSRSLLAPDPRPELPELLGTSILDHEVSGPPEESRATATPPDSAPSAPGERLDPPLPEAPQRISPVPEPGTALLVGVGLVWLGATRRRAARRRR